MVRDSWRDRDVFAVLSSDESSHGSYDARFSVIGQLHVDDAFAAVRSAKGYVDDNPNRRVVVVGWSLGRGIVTVAEWQRGILEPTYSYFSRDISRYYAGVIMTRVAEYLDTQARSIAEPPDAGAPSSIPVPPGPNLA